VSVTLGQAAGDVNTYAANNNTIRIQIPTSGYSNSASTAYLYTAVRTVTQPAAEASVTYTVALHAVPTGFSIVSFTGSDAIFIQGNIAQGTLNSVALSGNALSNGASTNLATVTNATLRALTLNITPGGSFTNSSAADFTYNIVQPSIIPTLTTGSIPTQSTVITGSTDIDLRNYFTNGKFFEITNDSATGSLVTASIVSGYILRLTGQGSCNDITGTTSAGSIVVAAFNEKATVDGSVAGSTASTSVVEKGDFSVSATVALNVTACAQNASLTMSLNSSSSTLDGCTIPTGTTSIEVFEIASAGSSFTNKMQFTISKSGTTLTTNMINVSTSSGFTPVLTANNVGTVTLGFSGTYPNLAVNANVNYTFTLNISTTATYTSAIQLNMTNAGYGVSGNGILSLSGTPSNSQAAMDSKTITATTGTFTADPTIYYSDQTPSGNNYIHVTSHTSGNPFVITQPSANGNSSFTITGTSKILSSDTSGSANVVLVTNTGVTNTVTGMTVHGVNVQSGGTGYHYSVNKSVANTTIPFTVAGTGNINVAVSNASVSGSVVNLNTSSGYGNFSGSCTIGTGAGSGTFTLTATPVGGTAYSITVSVQRITEDGTTGIRGYFYSGPHSVGATQADGYPAICDIAVGSNEIYSPSSSYNVGDTFYTTTEAAKTNGAQQGTAFAGGSNYYRVARTYAVNNSYIQLGNQTFYVQIDNNGQILSPGQITCGLNHP
tara:strand:- start:25 stop:2187 length:2163 start_codon:yes stop_codon:yes gene_type:complete